MQLNKKEGISFLKKFGLPTVKTIEATDLMEKETDLESGLSVRLSSKSSADRNVMLSSIHNCKDVNVINRFISENQGKYDIIIHKTVKPQTIGSISKLKFRESIIIETFKNFEDRKREIVDNRVIIPILGDKMYISKLEMLKKDKIDYNNFRKVIILLKDIPFEEYDMEYVIEDGNVVFTDLTLPNNREYNSFKNFIDER